MGRLPENPTLGVKKASRIIPRSASWEKLSCPLFFMGPCSTVWKFLLCSSLATSVMFVGKYALLGGCIAFKAHILLINLGAQNLF